MPPPDVLSQSRDSHQAAVELSMKNAHQLGIITRVSRRVVRCVDVNDICNVIEDAANQFSISGCFRAICAGEQCSSQFGRGISRDHCAELACVENCENKLTSTDTCAVFRTNHLLLVLLTDNMNAQDIGILKDNIMILIDTIHYWLENYEILEIKDREARNAKLAVANKMNDIVNTMLRFSHHLIERQQNLCQNLLSNLLVKLPSLGLEIDQEESMIMMISHANREHGKLIELQNGHNEEMRAVMAEAVRLLA